MTNATGGLCLPLIGVCALLLLAACRTDAQAPGDPWDAVPGILARISPPVFPDRDVPVTAFGAAGDGATDCSRAFRDAIEACASAGGGRVIVPRGTYLTGPIHLRSRVNLHLEEGAVVRFMTDPGRYLPLVFTRWEGVECMNYSPLIYAFDQTDIAVTGSGTLDGGAGPTAWWPWKGKKEDGWREGMPHQKMGRDSLFSMGQRGVPVEKRRMGAGFQLRPSFIEPYRCRNILIEGITIINSPMWEIHPVLSQNITVKDVRITSHGPNNDGCNPESCRDVWITGCTFDTGDDCIAIKSGRNNDGRRVNVPSENIVIQDCVFKDGHGGVTIGSEISGGVRNVFTERCAFESPVLYSALRLKNNRMRGGTIEQVYMRDVTVGLVDRAVVDIDLFYEEGRSGDFMPHIRDIRVQRMTVDRCRTALNLVGYDDGPLRDILLEDCTFRNVSAGYAIRNVEGLRLVRTTVNGVEVTP